VTFFFLPLKEYMGEKHFSTNEEMKDAVCERSREVMAEMFYTGI